MGRQTIRWVALAMIAAAGCGGDPNASNAGAHMRFPAPLPSGLTCLDESFAFVGLTAVAYIAGHEPCDLDVDPTSHEVSGSCPGITVGLQRPLMIVYTRGEDGSSAAATLAYAVGSVDLREESLPADPTQPILVALGGDDLIIDQTDVDAIAIPDDDCSQRDASDPGQWAKCEIRDQLGTSLLCGGSTVPNLVRACAGTLTCPKS